MRPRTVRPAGLGHARVVLVPTTLFLALALMVGPQDQPQRPAGERITAPPPEGGAPSGGAPTPPAPKLEAPPPGTETSRPADLGLERQPDGSYLYVDPSRRFTMTVTPDGRPYFADRWRRSSPGDAQHGKIGRRKGAHSFVVKGIGLGMQGPLEWLLRASGHDLNTSAKMAALRETAAFRTDLALAWTRAHVKARLHDLPAELLATWNDDAMTLAQRREILFEHWDACEDRLGGATEGLPPDAVPELDKIRRAAADEARVAVERFIRSQLSDPAQAYAADELRRFNARRVSVGVFDPYTEPAPEPAAATSAEVADTPVDPDPKPSTDTQPAAAKRDAP